MKTITAIAKKTPRRVPVSRRDPVGIAVLMVLTSTDKPFYHLSLVGRLPLIDFCKF